MSKELTPIEHLQFIRNYEIDEDHRTLNMFYVTRTSFDIIETALKVLEIIKEKKIDLDLLKISDDLDDYNFMCDMYYKNILTQEEFDLLKEVLL